MDIHDLLNSFIDDGWEEPAKVLYSMWDDQQKAITYKELKEAIRNGSLTVSDYMAWQQDYINWLNGPYAETVEKAVQFAHQALVDQYGGVLNIPSLAKIDEYISSHGGRLIREVSEGQFRAINTLVRQAMMTETLTVDELARCIRPCIGLTERQAMQTRKFYEQLREDGYSKSAALKKQQSFAEKLHRDRAKLIAQTEMAYAANYGMDATVHQNIEDGLISSDVDKEWSTARDERVCPICGSLHGETVKEDETFSNGDELPPAHPSCRCAVKYHMKPAERPKNKEQEEPEPLPTEESDGIINTGSDMHDATYDASHEALHGVDSDGYHHGITPEVQSCQSSDDIAALFTVDGKTVIDPAFGKFSLDTQQEAAEAISWAMKTYKLDSLPSSVGRGRLGKGVLGTYDDGTRAIMLKAGITRAEAFPTTVHEMTHHADNLMGFPSGSIFDEAVKNLKLRKGAGKARDFQYQIAGDKWDDPHELLAGSMERYSIGMGNPLAREMARLFLGRIGQ